MSIVSNKWPLYTYKSRHNTSQIALNSTEQRSANENDEQDREQDPDAERNRQYRPSKYDTICWHFSLVVLISTMILALVWTIYIGVDYYSCTPEQRFAQQRREFLSREQRRRVGGSLGLPPIEEVANQRLLALKRLDEKLNHVWTDYQPRPHFLAKQELNKSDLYEALRSMPKGGLLHVHDVGMFNTEVLLELTNYSDLWTCVGIDGEFEDFRFSKILPQIKPQGDYKCQWMLMSKLHMQDSYSYKSKLRERLSMDSKSFVNASHMADHMKRAQRLIYGLVSYQPMWETFLFSMLDDFHDDGINYVELRSSLPILYDLTGTNFTILDTVQTLVTITDTFLSEHKDFIGVKLIYAPVRDSQDSSMNSYIENARLLKSKFPTFVIGFDLISFGNECELPPLGNFPQLLCLSKEIDFYFHAGESRCLNTTGNVPDANLIDALLLGSKRLGNPINLPLHPEMLRAMKLFKIAAEVCPLSNHYLQYVNDFSQHPVAYLIAAGYPIVVGSDYPYFWNAAPLTDDFYATFVGIANGQSNLRLLKQLVINSFKYSALNEDDQTRALAKYQSNFYLWAERFVRQI